MDMKPYNWSCAINYLLIHDWNSLSEWAIRDLGIRTWSVAQRHEPHELSIAAPDGIRMVTSDIAIGHFNAMLTSFKPHVIVICICDKKARFK